METSNTNTKTNTNTSTSANTNTNTNTNTNANTNTNSNTNDNSSNPSLPKEKWCSNEFLYQFHNFWFPQTYLQSTQNVLQNFKPLPNDIILCSFPKTGTTWIKALVHSITHRSSSSSSNNSLNLNHPHVLIPSLETRLYIDDHQQVDQSKGKNTKTPEFPISQINPRILGTHIPFQILGEFLNSTSRKIIYITRNPKDTLISLWHFMQKSITIEQDKWELNAAVEQFCKGVVPFGPYYDHVLAFREESVKKPEKVMFLTYEELKENTRTNVKKIAGFLGCPFGDENEEQEVDEIVKNCSFEILSNHEVNKSSELPFAFPMPYSSFFRKGEAGDYVNYLDDEMIKKVDGVTKEKFHACGFIYGI